MKISRIFVTLFFALFVVPAFALLPPSYLSVKKWKSCASTYKKGSAEFVCMPNSKPIECPERSWQQLTEMSNLPACPSRGESIGSSAPGAQPVGSSSSR